MKVTISIALSEDVLRAIDRIRGESINRSAFIELALKDYLERKAKQIREQRDLEILNKNSQRLNREAEDVLSYQVEL